jgi:hypothetical protein
MKLNKESVLLNPGNVLLDAGDVLLNDKEVLITADDVKLNENIVKLHPDDVKRTSGVVKHACAAALCSNRLANPLPCPKIPLTSQRNRFARPVPLRGL